MRLRPILGAIAVLTLAAVPAANAGTTVLRSLTNKYTDAHYPVGKLAVGPSGGLFGFTQGGDAGGGTFVRMTTAGLTTTLRHLGAQPNDPTHPAAGPLYLSTAGGFFATSTHGGAIGYGTIFHITAGGTVSVLHSFAGGADGAYPTAGLTQALDGMLYGVTTSGGLNSEGTIFRIKTDGTGYTIVRHLDTGIHPVYSPTGALAEGADGYLYGTANIVNHYGGIFRVKKDGTGLGVVRYFEYTDPAGYSPVCDLIRATDNHIYGTTSQGGDYGVGTILRLNTTTQTVSAVWHFDGYTGANPGVNGYNQNRLLQGTDGKLYGTAPNGGALGYGAAFKFDPATLGCTLLASFGPLDANQSPNPLVQSGTAYYTTSYYGGATAALGSSTYYGYGCAMNISATGVVKNIHSFHIQEAYQPQAELTAYTTASPVVFYGVAPYGGLYEQGAIFKIDSTGKYSIVHNMNNSLNEGTHPMGGLVKAADNNLYGSTTGGGLYGAGTLFKMTSTGALTVIKHLRSAQEGSHPYQRMTVGLGTDKLLYGVCSTGGALGGGTMFSTDTTGKAFRVIHHFGGKDGSQPLCTPTPDLAGGSTTKWLYGTTNAGGSNATGILFKISPTGAVYTRLANLGSVGDPSTPWYAGGLLLYSSQLFGVSYSGGGYNNGVIYRADPNTGAITVVHHFDNTNGDGAYPVGGLAVDGSGNMYGVTHAGGAVGYGTLYKFHAPSSTFSLLKTFGGQAAVEPATPMGGAILAGDGKIYGTTTAGGAENYGTIYSATTTP